VTATPVRSATGWPFPLHFNDDKGL